MADFTDFKQRFEANDDINDLFSIINGSPDRSGIPAPKSRDSVVSTIVDI